MKEKIIAILSDLRPTAVFTTNYSSIFYKQ